jgi:hypothetical protein
MSEDVKRVVIQKLAVVNPNTVKNSGARNVALWNMSEMDRMKQGPKMMAEAAQEAATHNTENAMMPNPEQRPARRSTLV